MNRRINDVLSLALGATVVPVEAEIHRVDRQSLAPVPDGDTWATAYPSLQTALELSSLQPGDEIWVADGTYLPTATFPDPNDPDSQFKTFSIPKGIGVYGGFRGYDPVIPGEAMRVERNPEVNLTVLDGNINNPNDASDNSYHVVYIRDNTNSLLKTTLSGFTIRNGYADGPGEASKGGGVLVTSIDEVNGHAAPLLNQLIIENNYAAAGGGGIRVAGGKRTYLTNCRIQFNVTQAGNGGGLLQDGPGSTDFVAQNCILYQNTCTSGYGGGAYGDGDFVNCTFSGNSSTQGGAAYTSIDECQRCFPGTLVNCIVWGHETQPIWGLPTVWFSNIEGGLPVDPLDYSLGWQNRRRNMSVDPRFVDQANGDLEIRDCSPSIDAGIDVPFGNTPYGITSDATSIDDDTNFGELTPWDLKRQFARIVQNFAATPGYNDPYLDPNAPPEPNVPTTAPAYVDMGAFETCVGDIDGNRIVGLPDLAILLTCFGLGDCTSAPGCCAADLTCDNAVTLPDMATLLANFGVNCNANEEGFGGGEGLMSGPSDSDAVLRAWLQSATLEQIMEWFHAGMPPFGENEY